MRTKNWADHLPGDLLDLILSNLFGKDRLSFSRVCRHWNAVAATSPYRYSPCLMYYYRRTRTWKFYQYNTFLDVSFPELENAEIRCSKHGWLLMSRFDDTLFFFDPSNYQKIELPCQVHRGCISLSFFNPPTSPECVVVGIQFYYRVTTICTLERGEDDWEIMECPPITPSFWVSLAPPVLHRGLIYILSVDGEVAILDIEQWRFDVNFKCLGVEGGDKTTKQYLFKLNDEDALFAVFVFEEERKVNVFRLSSGMNWDMMDGIGDKVLYLSNFSSFGDKARTKSMENTIYFPKFHGDVAVFYSLSDGKYHSLDGNYLDGNAYGLKGLDLAAWIMPIPAQEVFPTSLSWL